MTSDAATDGWAGTPRPDTLPGPLIDELVRSASVVRLAAGDWLFRQGDAPDRLYIVRSGRLEVVLESAGAPRRINALTAGDLVGELALITGEPRSASVRARRDSELAAVDRSQFEGLLLDKPEFALALVHRLAESLQSREPVAPPEHQALRVMSVLDGGDPAAGWLRDLLLGELRRHREVTTLDGSEHGHDIEASARLLDRYEAEHELVVLFDRPGPLDDPWNTFCARQGDAVLIVAPVGARPPQRLEGTPPTHVALWGRRATAADWAPWIEQLAPVSHHDLGRPPSAAPAVARLARRALGRSVGVVLSGGGARALAHIGVLETLADAGIVIDRVGGTSMGSFIGGLVALGLDAAEIAEVCHQELVLNNAFNDYTVPRVALLRAAKAEQMLQRVFGTAHIEELPLDYFAVSCDLVTASTVVDRQGPLWEAIGTSMSIPGLVPPVPLGAQVLVDGGLLDNLPIAAMATEPGTVIAVDVMGSGWNPRRVRSEARPAAAGLRGWLSNVGGLGPEQVPTIVETLTRTSVMGSWRAAAEHRARADLVIAPDVARTGLLDFAAFDDLVAHGRAGARAALDAQSVAIPRAASTR